MAFRGGTALHKIYLSGQRFSEDIDLVQVEPIPFGSVMTNIRKVLSPWLGKPSYKQTEGRVTFYFKYETEISPKTSVKLKVEANTREQFTVLGYEFKELECLSNWFSGSAKIRTFAIEELSATKLRALYQRKKGRDLFDLWLVLSKLSPDSAKVISSFERYINHQGLSISKAEFEQNLNAKLADELFIRDVAPIILKPEEYDPIKAGELVTMKLLSQMN